MVRARFDQILLSRKRREGWRRVNSINAIRNCHIVENPAMRLEGKKEQLRAGWGGVEGVWERKIQANSNEFN